ncbi:hypothetical protein R1flu_022817 [Riccia fluitans]|uniref:Uncharacterized protein n=1 Tax=Riccia fluitans TaxID=41844 RepID=A0ABD1XQT1_9MARC
MACLTFGALTGIRLWKDLPTCPCIGDAPNSLASLIPSSHVVDFPVSAPDATSAFLFGCFDDLLRPNYSNSDAARSFFIPPVPRLLPLVRSLITLSLPRRLATIDNPVIFCVDLALIEYFVVGRLVPVVSSMWIAKSAALCSQFSLSGH